MRVNFLCPSCSKENVYVPGEPWEGFACEHCGAAIRLGVSPSITQGDCVAACIVCGRLWSAGMFIRSLGCGKRRKGAVGLSVWWWLASRSLASSAAWGQTPSASVCVVYVLKRMSAVRPVPGEGSWRCWSPSSWRRQQLGSARALPPERSDLASGRWTKPSWSAGCWCLWTWSVGTWYSKRWQRSVAMTRGTRWSRPGWRHWESGCSLW